MDDAKKIVEKHVFGNSGFSRYSEVDVAETLRNSGGDIAGGSENIAVFVPSRQSDLMPITSMQLTEWQCQSHPNGVCMGAKSMSEVEIRSSDCKDSAKVIGFDCFNYTPTYQKTITLQASRADTNHLPVVFIRRNINEK